MRETAKKFLVLPHYENSIVIYSLSHHVKPLKRSLVHRQQKVIV